MKFRLLFAVVIPAAALGAGMLLTLPDPQEPLFTVPSLGTASLIEALWLLAGLVAYIATVRHLPELVADWTAMRETESETLPLTAQGYLVREVLRMSSALGTIVLGVYASLAASPRPGPVQVSLVGVILTIVLLGQAVLVGTISILDWRNRLKLEKLIEEGKNGH